MTTTTIRRIKTFIKSEYPALARFGRALFHLSLRMRSPESVFTKYYKKNMWGDDHSYSGTGSNLAQTAVIRRAIPLLIKEFGCQSLLDAPCGDFYWMSHTDLNIPEYTGADIVEGLIKSNQQNYGSANRKFIRLNIITDPIPKVDLIFCRDCLVHFSYVDIIRTLKNIQDSGSQYLLTTTFVGRTQNEDIPTGSWRPLNLQVEPFCLPSPLQLIDEQCTENNGIYLDKHLGLWRITDLAL